MNSFSKVLSIATCLAVAGCGASSQPATSKPAGPASSQPAVSATSSAGSSAADPLPTAKSFCFLLTRAQLRAVLGHAVSPGYTTGSTRQCNYTIAPQAGTVAITVGGFPSAAAARRSYQQQLSTKPRGVTVTPIAGLGQAAMAARESGRGATSAVLTGSDLLAVVIYWPSATAQMAAALARVALRHL